jgi:hypothetical protein
VRERVPQKLAKSDCFATILDSIHLVALTGDEKAAEWRRSLNAFKRRHCPTAVEQLLVN